MIHIVTVHFEDDSWIDVQLSYFKRFIDEEYRVYTSLEGISRDYDDKFYYTTHDLIGKHHHKLNVLGDLVCMHANCEEDILLFIDGDAFPIAPVSEFFADKFKSFPLLAAQRLENNGDCQPHPCFCATTVGYWKKIKGDWNKGYRWKDQDGNLVTDTGGNLLGIIEERRDNWFPLVRTNKKNLHPLLFGIYGDIAYHHGAGFRGALLRIDDPIHRSRSSIVDFLNKLPNSFGLYRLKKMIHPIYKPHHDALQTKSFLVDLQEYHLQHYYIVLELQRYFSSILFLRL